MDQQPKQSEDEKKKYYYYKKKAIPPRSRIVFALDDRVIDLIREHYGRKGHKMNEHIEAAVLKDLGITLPEISR